MQCTLFLHYYYFGLNSSPFVLSSLLFSFFFYWYSFLPSFLPIQNAILFFYYSFRVSFGLIFKSIFFLSFFLSLHFYPYLLFVITYHFFFYYFPFLFLSFFLSFFLYSNSPYSFSTSFIFLSSVHSFISHTGIFLLFIYIRNFRFVLRLYLTQSLPNFPFRYSPHNPIFQRIDYPQDPTINTISNTIPFALVELFNHIVVLFRFHTCLTLSHNCNGQYIHIYISGTHAQLKARSRHSSEAYLFVLKKFLSLPFLNLFPFFCCILPAINIHNIGNAIRKQ